MRITAELARFITGPVLMTIATRDAANRPLIARGSGGHVSPDLARVDVAVSARLWPETIAHVRENGMFTVTFVQPADYRAFQVKGRAEVRPATPEDEARAEAYVAGTEALLTPWTGCSNRRRDRAPGRWSDDLAPARRSARLFRRGDPLDHRHEFGRR